MRRSVSIAVLVLCLAPLANGEDFIPRRQTQPPGPPLSPQEAIAKMTVPDGFTVELVASEPDIVNPVAMAIDERGRFWITESFEYPRREPGKGRDRVKVAEDTDGDGRADKFTVFAEGLNIPSGIAVGHGGVWVANSPDILFLQDTDGDGKADKQEVVVTGFGRSDTHELPNSLTWGPDGWLYGLNGVFNHSHVHYPKSSPHYREDHPGWAFTCALFRIHPRTREFQVFCEGTSNPWGVAFDTAGSAFVSACVIDHLWHLVESGYYHRQGGPYPPFTWKIDSIVKHKHQAAAYCGIHFFDSDAYPVEYREKLFMGNIHGGCVNVDRVTRDGSTYFGHGKPDFLTANDVWFMPVVQKTGPDGSLYILDWYDRYHCYQDANRDPPGVDRLKGRLYRVRYKDTPRAAHFDLGKKSDNELVDLLGSGNDFIRHTAQRLLVERTYRDAVPRKPGGRNAVRESLRELIASSQTPPKQRMHALFAYVGAGPLHDDDYALLLNHADSAVRAWGVRAAGNQRQLFRDVPHQVIALADDPSPDVKLQVAIAACKLKGVDPLPVLLRVLETSGDDKLIPHIVWQNLHPLLENQGERFIEEIAKHDLANSESVARLMPRAMDRLLAVKGMKLSATAKLLDALTAGTPKTDEPLRECLVLLTQRAQSREINGERLQELNGAVQPLIVRLLAGDAHDPLYLSAATLAASWRDPAALTTVAAIFQDNTRSDADRLQAFTALASARAPRLVAACEKLLRGRSSSSPSLRGAVLSGLSNVPSDDVAAAVLRLYPTLDANLQPRAIELLTQRAGWARQLVAQIDAKEIPASAVNVNQLRKLLSFDDPQLKEAVAKHWGTIRADRDPKREELISQMRKLLDERRGDPSQGKAVFTRVCGQCHKLHGEGQDVGPDITNNGRGSFDQLLSNVFDPSLVIGASYQARTVLTTDGRVLSGLLVEDSDQRIVLKGQGGKLETIPRDEVDAVKVSELSLMPEGLEKQLKPQEIADLFAYLRKD